MALILSVLSGRHTARSSFMAENWIDKMLPLILTFVFAIITGASSTSIYEGLFNHVKLHHHSSNPTLPPISDTSTPFMVGLHLGLEDISQVDVQNNHVEISLMLSLTWNSSILWNPADFHGLKSIPILRNQIWCPKITILNAVSRYHDNAPPDTLLLSNGLAGTIHQYHLKIFCDVTNKGGNDNKCNVSAAILTHGTDLIHLYDPKDAVAPGIESFFALSRHTAPAYTLQGSRIVKSTFRNAGLPGEKERIDLEFTFRNPRHRHSTTTYDSSFFPWN